MISVRVIAFPLFFLALGLTAQQSYANGASDAFNIITGILGKSKPVETTIKGELVQEAACLRPLIWKDLRVIFSSRDGDKDISFSVDVDDSARFKFRQIIKHGEYLLDVQDTRTFKSLLKRKVQSTAFGNLKLVVPCS